MSSILILVASLFLISCIPSTEKSSLTFNEALDDKNQTPKNDDRYKDKDGKDDGVGIYDRSASIRAFGEFVHPVLRTGQCLNCHGDSESYSPFFSKSNLESSWAASVEGGKIDYNNPRKSRLVQRALDENHNCGVNCETWGNQLLAGVTQWASIEKNLRDVAKGRGHTTHLQSFNDALKNSRWAQTENGVVMLQAEAGELLGRARVGSHSKASGTQYVSGFILPVHPYDVTVRNGSNRVGCNVASASLDSGTNGPFVADEVVRHVAQDGHLPYSVSVGAYIIRPDKRAAYRTALQNGTVNDTNLMTMILKNGSYKPGQNPDLGGAPVTVDNIFRVLPGMRSWDELERIKADSSEKNFFGPRFNSAYYSSETIMNIINRMPDDYRKFIVYRAVWNRIRGLYYNNPGAGNESDRPLTNKIPFIRPGTTYDTFNEFFPLSYEQSDDVLFGNALSMDGFVHYYIEPASRQPNQDVQTRFYNASRGEIQSMRKSYDMTLGSTRVNLLNMFVGSGSEQQTLVDEESKKSFSETLHLELRSSSCINCHGDGSTRSQFSQASSLLSWEIIKNNKFVNLNNPASSRMVQRVIQERHNCGNSNQCDLLGNKFIDSISKWGSTVNNFIDTLPQTSGFIAYSQRDRTPAHARYHFIVKEQGRFNVWLKLRTMAGGDNFYVRILNSDNKMVDSFVKGGSKENCTDDYDFAEDIADWTWTLPSRGNGENRRYWELSPGEYTLEVFERLDGAQIDMVAISSNPEFAPHDNVIDEGNISAPRPNVLRYDISERIGKEAYFEVELINFNNESWMLKNPRFISPHTNIRVSGIKVRINEVYEFNNATWNSIERVVGNDRVMTFAPLLAIKQAGTNDNFSFEFSGLEATSDPVSVVKDDKPIIYDGRKCLRLDLFVKTVEPILNTVSLMLKDDNGYEDYVASFPGSNRNVIGRPQIYNCTTCHNEGHPYFKMTTFFDPNETNLDKKYGEFCAQALSRVDFENFYGSLFIRGLNGTHNHPKLHFMEDANYNSSNTDFLRDGSGNVVRTWMGSKYARYTASELRVTNYSGSSRTYLEKFVGQPKVFEYMKYSGATWIDNVNIINPNDNSVSLYDEIMLQEDDISPNAPYSSRSRNTGTNRWYVINPESYVNNQTALPPGIYTGTNRNNLRSKQLVIDRSINTPELFEEIKAKYREGVIRWMEAEKAAYEKLISQ